MGSCITVQATTSLCNGKDGEQWTGLKFILEVESRLGDGLDVRASAKLRITSGFSVWVTEDG